MIDPCVGQGTALNLVTSDAPVRRYGVELDAERARIGCSKGIETIGGIYTSTTQNLEQLAKYDGSGNLVHENVLADGRLLATYTQSTSAWIYAFNDWLGTKREQVTNDGNGNNLLGFTGLPFGDDLSLSGVSATEDHFTGKGRDNESGNDYFGAGYYASSMGRFLSPDWSARVVPVPYAKLDNPQSLNRYAYVGNNPLSRFDPDGHWVCSGSTDQCVQFQTRLTLAQSAQKQLAGSDEPNAQKAAKAIQRYLISMGRSQPG